MAEIYGVQLKNVKRFCGIEGTGGFNASIYLDGKKAGFAIDDDSGAGIYTNGLSEEDRKTLEARAKAYFTKYPKGYDIKDIHIDDLIEELLKLLWLEKEYKKSAKAGYPVIIDVRYQPRNTPLDKYDFKLAQKAFVTTYQGFNEKTEEAFKKKYQPVEYDVYKSLNDFIIKEA